MLASMQGRLQQGLMQPPTLMGVPNGPIPIVQMGGTAPGDALQQQLGMPQGQLLGAPGSSGMPSAAAAASQPPAQLQATLASILDDGLAGQQQKQQKREDEQREHDRERERERDSRARSSSIRPRGNGGDNWASDAPSRHEASGGRLQVRAPEGGSRILPLTSPSPSARAALLDEPLDSRIKRQRTEAAAPPRATAGDTRRFARDTSPFQRHPNVRRPPPARERSVDDLSRKRDHDRSSSRRGGYGGYEDDGGSDRGRDNDDIKSEDLEINESALAALQAEYTKVVIRYIQRRGWELTYVGGKNGDRRTHLSIRQADLPEALQEIVRSHGSGFDYIKNQKQNFRIEHGRDLVILHRKPLIDAALELRRNAQHGTGYTNQRQRRD